MRVLPAFCVWAAGVSAVMAGPAAAQDERPETTWTELRPSVVGERPIRDGAGLVSLEAPKRAEDAAIVPVTLHIALPRAMPAG